MESAFGVEHGEISKLGSPKYKGYMMTAYEQQKDGVQQRHVPTDMKVKDAGKSLILRRQKYELLAQPGKKLKDAASKGQAVTVRRQRVKPDKVARNEIHNFMQTKEKSKNIRGINVTRSN